MMTDPIADMLTRIRNAIQMRHAQVTIPHSRLKESILRILKQEGFVADFEVVGEKKAKSLVVVLRYTEEGEPAITTLRRLSKPGRRIYSACDDMKPFRGGLGLRVVTTSRGVLSDQEARKKKLGGEILLEVW